MDWIKDNYLVIWVAFLQFAVFMKNTRDAIDRTPLIDDNWFERIVTIIGKIVAALTVGKRPQASKEIIEVVGPIANATGVRVADIIEVKGDKIKVK